MKIKKKANGVDCLFVGGSTKDLIMCPDHIPAPDERVKSKEYITCCGGVSATAASAYRKLGGRTGIITIVGTDEAGEFIKRDLARQGFEECQVLETKGAPSSVSLIQVDERGRRSITHYGGCISKLSFEMLDRELLEKAGAIHLGVMEEELMLNIAQFCEERENILLSIDGGNLSLELSKKLLPYTDIWILDEGTVNRTLGKKPEEACRIYCDMSGKAGFFTAVTLGDKGAVGFDGKEFFRSDSYAVTVKDTTGAGDNYHGAFLYALSRGLSYPECMEFAGIFASLTCREYGGRKGEPFLEEVLEIIKQQKQEGMR